MDRYSIVLTKTALSEIAVPIREQRPPTSWRPPLQGVSDASQPDFACLGGGFRRIWPGATRMMASPRKAFKVFQEFGQSMLSLSFNLGGLLAGTILALNLDLLEVAPWAIVLFPCILSIRGAIGGLFSGRLSTALHLGTISASYTKNTKSFYLLFSSVVVLTLGSSIIMSSVTLLIGGFFWGVALKDFFDMIIVTVGTMGLSIILLSPVTVGVSFLAFKHGFNPDVITYPVTSTTADIIVTICYISLLEAFSAGGSSRYVIELLDLLFIIAALYLAFNNRNADEFVRTIKEFLLTLILVTVIVNITGFVLREIKESIGNRPEIYMIYPALIDTVGDVGSIVGSTATTKLFMGMIRPSLSSMGKHLTEIFSSWTASIAMFILYFALAFTVHNAESPIDPSSFLGEVLATNLISVSFMVVLVYLVAVLTFKKAWNPDNFVIPIESSIADAVTTISLLIAILTVP